MGGSLSVSDELKRILNNAATSGDNTEYDNMISGIKHFYNDSGLNNDIDQFIPSVAEISNMDDTNDKYLEKIKALKTICEKLTKNITIGYSRTTGNYVHKACATKNGDNSTVVSRYFYILDETNKLLNEKTGGNDNKGVKYDIIICTVVFIILYLICTLLLKLPEIIAGVVSAVGLYLIGSYKFLASV
jgi:hypothetical protein